MGSNFCVGEAGGVHLDISELFRSTPRTCPPPGGRLSMRESLRPYERGHAMSERIEERQSRASDIVAMVFYSILVLLLVLMSVYVPA
jgi:hypothetical protein